jgi:hypothetical protein
VLTFYAVRNLLARDESDKETAREQTRKFALAFAFIMLCSMMPETLLENWVVAALSFAGIVACGYYAMRWLLRTRWAGSLASGVTQNRPVGVTSKPAS